MTKQEMARVQQGPCFPLYINEDGSIGKKIDLGNGGYVQVNDARYVDSFMSMHKKFNDECKAFHEKLFLKGVLAYRCNDGWVDREKCRATFFYDEKEMGYYWSDMCLKPKDKIFIGDAHDGGRMAEVLCVIHKDDSVIEVAYKPLSETIDGISGNGQTKPYITKNNAPKRTLWQRLFGKEPIYDTDIYTTWPLPEEHTKDKNIEDILL